MLTELAFCAHSSRSTQGIVYLKKALRYIDEHYLEDIDIPAISAYAGINKSYLQALFTEKNGCTINTYINRKRMEQASFFCATVLCTLRILPFLPDTTAGSILHIPSKNFII